MKIETKFNIGNHVKVKKSENLGVVVHISVGVNENETIHTKYTVWLRQGGTEEVYQEDLIPIEP